MTKRKIGESQVIDFFSSALRDELYNKFGSNSNYSIGNFSGSQDRKYADFFAGTNSSCVLIEFKEFESEIRDEYRKPLREKLCKNLTGETAALSRATHFIAHRISSVDMNIKLSPYVDVICPNWSVGSPPLQAICSKVHYDFIDDFLSAKEGVVISEFLRYAGHLNSTAGGIADGIAAPFKSVLYSRNTQGRIVGTIFNSLGELKQLIGKAPKVIKPGNHTGLLFS
ncbi:hypothetical protein [Pseudomonas lurida]|uniref:hypothetical protein n=1 Tax=Pseudomonas lurida TaxID=244566 RepID=UPI00273722BF|nr:hypothetical protein [Pseudomonas lurida]WLG25989.1 hypothetical protein PSH68_14265 [Pseudomonas lurida]